MDILKWTRIKQNKTIAITLVTTTAKVLLHELGGVNWTIFAEKTFQAAQLTNKRFFTLLRSRNIFFISAQLNFHKVVKKCKEVQKSYFLSQFFMLKKVRIFQKKNFH